MENESLHYFKGLTNLSAEKFIDHLKSIHKQLENDTNVLEMNEIVNDFTMYKSCLTITKNRDN